MCQNYRRNYRKIVNIAGHEVWHRDSVPLGPEAAGGQVAFKLLAYGSGSNPDVNISFNAAQPGGFGGFVFGVQLGHLNHQVQASSIGAVGVAGSNGFGYLAATQTYGKQVPAQTLLTHNHLADSCICPPIPPAGSGAFSEVLSVYAAVTNGYDRLWWLDRYDHAGFALVQN